MASLKFTDLSKGDEKNEDSGKGKIITFLTSLNFLAIVIILLQVGIFGYLFFTNNFGQDALDRQIINEAAKLTSVNPGETPLIAVIKDVDSLKATNAIQQQVYKDAQNGDYVIGYTDKMIIYRRSTGKLIYDGESPASLLSKSQQSLIDNLISKSKEQAVITPDSTEQPQVSVIDTIDTLKAQNPDFYGNVENSDLVALFANESKIVIYRPSTNTIVKVGEYSFAIK